MTQPETHWALAVACVCAVPASAAGQFMPYPGEVVGEAPVGEYAHDGFMARAGLGIGFGVADVSSEVRLTSSDGGPTSTVTTDAALSGLAVPVTLDLGWSLFPNFVLHGRLSQLVMPSAAVSHDDPVQDMEGLDPRRASADVSLALLGPALTYYAMPAHLVLTLAVGAAVEQQGEFDGDDGLSDVGFALNADVGKGFWVGEQWTLEVCLRLWWSWTRGEDSRGGSQSLSVLAVGPVFQLTYQ